MKDKSSYFKSSSNAKGPRKKGTSQLERTTFRTSRLLDFCNRKELIAQTGHQPDAWSLVLLKELLDNSLDAAEDAGIPPVVTVTVNEHGITLEDNGPGIPPETVNGILDFSVRVSSREAYVSPTRGAQGNALKTILAMPFVLDGEQGHVTIEAKGIRHAITFGVDRIRQTPKIEHRQEDGHNRTGTKIGVLWPDSASSILTNAKSRFLQIADDYTFLNPHLTLKLDWFGEHRDTMASDPHWIKWLPSNPTSAHWYDRERFIRLLSAYVAHDADHGKERTVRAFVAEFDGLSSTAKQTKVLDETGLKRASLTSLAGGSAIDAAAASKLLDAMKRHSKPIKPARLGAIGRDMLMGRFEALGCQPESIQYKKSLGEMDGIPWVQETAFGYCPTKTRRRLITGVNWSPGIINPFRELGRFGQSLDSVLESLRAGREEPVILFLHLACPRVEYTDRGKSAVVIGSTARHHDEEE
jgi:DNA topoisomerase VI subunit B